MLRTLHLKQNNTLDFWMMSHKIQRVVSYHVMDERFLPSGASVEKKPNPALRQKLTTEHKGGVVGCCVGKE